MVGGVCGNGGVDVGAGDGEDRMGPAERVGVGAVWGCFDGDEDVGSDSPKEGDSSLTPTRSVPVPRMSSSSVSVVSEGDVERRGRGWTVEGFLYGTADYINKKG